MIKLTTLIISAIFLFSFSISMTTADGMMHEEKMQKKMEKPEEMMEGDEEKMQEMHEKMEEASDEKMRPMTRDRKKKTGEEAAGEEEFKEEGE